MDIFSNFSVIVNEENRYLACIEGSGNQALTCSIIDGKDNKIISSFPITNVLQFIYSIPTFFTKSFKNVVLEVFNYCSFAPYQNNHEFCQALKSQFIQAQVHAHFLTNQEWIIARILVEKRYISNNNNIISIIMVDELLGVVTDYIFTRNGYRQLAFHEFSVTVLENIKEEILQKNPKAVFLIETKSNTVADMERKYSEFKAAENLANIKSILSKSAPTVIYAKESEVTNESMIKTLKQIIDKSCIQCKFVPHSFKEYILRIKSDGSPILSIESMRRLPLKMSKIVDKFVDEITVTSGDPNFKPLTLYSCQPSTMAHRHEIILEVDKENFVSCEVKSIILEKIKCLPLMLSKTTTKVPVIGFLQNLSFICIRKNSKADFEFLQSWNDIIKLMSLPPKMLKTYKSANFKITKDDENPVLVEFDNSDGEKHAASPVFLLALMLKEHFKAIKEEIGKKPKKVEFILFDDFKDTVENCVEAQIKEACEMLRVSCCFIKV
uniref:Uncharacterized protein n=1 Tax=Panagrolaimus sp. ES5 TaxID=591445 RepID=A0AC34F877_9BILA